MWLFDKIQTRERLTDKKDLCMAALEFCYDTLRPGGHFLCKFYQGADDGKALEMRLRALFERVHREKPPLSRKVSLWNRSNRGNGL